ncbi:MAG: hypothetical protein ACREE6_06095, partial [Limisphaerales bacterium]
AQPKLLYLMFLIWFLPTTGMSLFFVIFLLLQGSASLFTAFMPVCAGGVSFETGPAITVHTPLNS